TGDTDEGKSGCDFERSGGTESSAHGDIALDFEIGSVQPMAEAFEHHGYAANVIAPVARGVGGPIVQRKFATLADVGGTHAEHPVEAFRGGDGGRKVDGGGHDEAIVVIGE